MDVRRTGQATDGMVNIRQTKRAVVAVAEGEVSYLEEFAIVLLEREIFECIGLTRRLR